MTLNASEAIDVLAAAAIVDKRTVGESEARMWAEILPSWIRKEDAVRAVAMHYRETSAFLMPAHVIDKARTVRSDRVRDAGQPQYPDGIDGPDRRGWFDAWVKALFAGCTVADAEDYADATTGRRPRHGTVLALERRTAEIARLNPPPLTPPSDGDDRW